MRAYDTTSKVFYKGASDDFIVFIDDPAALKNWKNDRSIPLADVVNGFKIFVTHRYASQLTQPDSTYPPYAKLMVTADTDRRACSTAPATPAWIMSLGLITSMTAL